MGVTGRTKPELLRLRWIAGHALAVIAVVAFISLGFWQLRRHQEKADLRADVAAAQAMEPLPIEEAAAGSYRRVTAVGEYDAALQVLVLRSQGGVSGHLVLTPLLFTDETAVLVSRAWLPLDETPGPPASGPVAVEGTLWPAEEGSSIPDRLPEVVRRIDPEIQAQFADYRLRDEYLVLVAPPPQPPLVLPAAPSIPPGPHLGYAGQWFLFATIVVVGYPVLLVRRRRT